MKYFLLNIVLLCLCSNRAFAYDFRAENADGVTIFYNLINDGKELQVTNFKGNVSYWGKVVIPEEVTYGEQKLKVTSIGSSAFRACTINSVVIPNSVTSIEQYAFSDCDDLPSIIFPESLTTIRNGAFASCDKLSRIKIPRNVTTIEGGAFACCEKLYYITIDENNPVYDARNDCNAVIRTADNTLIVGCRNTKIPDGVETLGEGAFATCYELQEITIPVSVKCIEGSAFEGCLNLRSIIIPENVTIIGGWAFAHCQSLENVVVPKGIKQIGEGAFNGCYVLKDFYCYAEEVPTTGKDIFYSSRIASATLHVPSSAISIYQSTLPWKNFQYIVALADDSPDPSAVKTIISDRNHLEEVGYTLEGRKLESRPTTSGIYIIKGKKIVMK